MVTFRLSVVHCFPSGIWGVDQAPPRDAKAVSASATTQIRIGAILFAGPLSYALRSVTGRSPS